MGRSRGGLSSKIHAVVDTNGLPVQLALTAGEAHDNRLAGKLLSRLKSGIVPRPSQRTSSVWERRRLVEEGRDRSEAEGPRALVANTPDPNFSRELRSASALIRFQPLISDAVTDIDQAEGETEAGNGKLAARGAAQPSKRLPRLSLCVLRGNCRRGTAPSRRRALPDR
jgi:hypothetical protein